jgi:hypothetical protein
MLFAIINDIGIATAKAVMSQYDENQFPIACATSAKLKSNATDGIKGTGVGVGILILLFYVLLEKNI